MDRTDEVSDGRVRKRIANACTRCRQQKIKCSGTVPCAQCSRRAVRCVFDDRHQKVFVSQKYLAQLERRAAGQQELATEANTELESGEVEVESHVPVLDPTLEGTRAQTTTANVNDVNVHEVSESEGSPGGTSRVTSEGAIRNPIDPNNPDSFTVNVASKHYYLGVSSNWSFGRRVFQMVHDKMHDRPLSTSELFFEGSTYDLGWDGQRSSVVIDPSCLPTSDFALFLINAVKFRCGGLFHMYDETIFMHAFSEFYTDPQRRDLVKNLWTIHFLIILAFGKAFTIHKSREARPPGADLFVQALQLLPDITYLQNHPLQSIEILCCGALYLQCLDLRSAAYNMIGQAMRLALEQGLHTDLKSRHLSDDVVERCRRIWWTVFVLDRQMTSLMGVPMAISDDEITAPLPSFDGSSERLLATSLHVKLAKAQAVILHTVYGKSGRKSERFITSMKEALKTLAETNDQRNVSFPIDLRNPHNAISRVSAYLHLFHHQALILATRPLLFSFLQKRLQSSKTIRVPSSHGARSLLRVCVSSALQCLSILEFLQDQNLLENFIPFDLDATSTSALVLTIVAAVDPSLIRGRSTRIDLALSIFDEMTAGGNLIATHQRRELEQLKVNLELLHDTGNLDKLIEPLNQPTAPPMEEASTYSSSDLNGIDSLLHEWNSEDGLTGEDLLAVADSFDFDQLDWPTFASFDQPTDTF